MGSKYVKNLTTYVTLALIIASVFVGMSVALPVGAEGTITLSSSNLHPWKVIEITVNIPGLDANYTELRVTDEYGQPITLTYKIGSLPTGVLRAAKIATGVFVAYLGGAEVNLNANPAYPKKDSTGTVPNIAKLPSTVKAGDTINIEVLGYGLTASLTYDTVKPASITLDRSEVPSRRTDEYTVTLTLEDQDLNLDPTKVDQPNFPLMLNITWISGTTGRSLTKTIAKYGSDIKETAVNSGKFKVSLKVSELTPEGATLGPGDIFLITAYSNILSGKFSDDVNITSLKLTIERTGTNRTSSGIGQSASCVGSNLAGTYSVTNALVEFIMYGTTKWSVKLNITGVLSGAGICDATGAYKGGTLTGTVVGKLYNVSATLAAPNKVVANITGTISGIASGNVTKGTISIVATISGKLLRGGAEVGSIVGKLTGDENDVNATATFTLTTRIKDITSSSPLRAEITKGNITGAEAVSKIRYSSLSPKLCFGLDTKLGCIGYVNITGLPTTETTTSGIYDAATGAIIGLNTSNVWINATDGVATIFNYSSTIYISMLGTKAWLSGANLSGDGITNVTVSVKSWGKEGDNTKYLTTRLNVVYRYPKVTVIFTQQKVTIRIESPDDNVDPLKKDVLKDDVLGRGVRIGFVVGDWLDYAGKWVDASLFQETGKDTGVFEYNISIIGWDSPRVYTSPARVFRDNLDTVRNTTKLPLEYEFFTVVATYLDRSGSATYVTTSPTVDVVKASPVNVILSISDKDLNINSKSVEMLTADNPAGSNVLKFRLGGTGAVLYEVTVKDSTGRAVPLPSGYQNDVAFFETDLDSGIFTLSLKSVSTGGTVVFAPNKSYIIDIKDYTGNYSTRISFTITPIKITLDKSVYPVNKTTDVVVYVTYYDDTKNRDSRIRDTAPADTLKYKVVSVNNEVIDFGNLSRYLLETGPNTGVFSSYIILSANNPKWIDAKLIVYLASDPKVNVTATFRPYQLTSSDISVNVSTVGITGCFKVTVNDPDANVDSGWRDSFYVNVTNPRGGIYRLKVTETDYDTGVFEGEFCIPEVRSLGFDVRPGDTLTIEHIELTPILAPTVDSFDGTEYKISTTVKVTSSTGELVVPKDWIGPYEIMTIQVKDPDLNLNPSIAERYMGTQSPVKFTIEGEAGFFTVNLEETGINTGVFEGKINLTSALEYILRLRGITTPKPEDFGKFIGKVLTLTYVDEADASGARVVVVKSLTIKAVDAEILVDKEAVNVGDTLKITIKNADIAGNPRPEFRRVTIRSTTYPTGTTLYALEVEPGVYEVSVKVVSLSEWVREAPQIPAKLGDKIDIIYEDPIAADGTTKTFMKSVGVGVYAAMPGKTEATAFVDPVTGAPVTPTVGKEVFLSVTLKNVDIVEHSMTVIVVVRDPNGVAVGRFAATVTLGAGASTEVSWGWTPIVAGSHTVEVYIVKSLADRTPIGELYTTTVTVSS